MSTGISKERCSIISKDEDTSDSRFTLLDASFLILSLCTFVADISTDVVVVSYYLHDGQWPEASILLVLLFLSSIMINFFSLRWHVVDEEDTFTKWLCNGLQFGIIYRYVAILKEGFSQRKRPNDDRLLSFYQHQSDVSMLRLFESFLESGPQLVLQLYLMCSTQKWNYFTEISAGVSVISLAGGIASYNKTQRMANPSHQKLSWLGVFLQMFWRMGTLTSRIMAMVLCASILHGWFALIMFAHWIGMTVWVVLQRTDFCPTPWEERLYNCIVGVIYCFCFFNLKDGNSRYRLTVFYTVIFLEDIVFTMLYYWLGDPENHILVIFLLIVIISFFIGLMSMMIYYACFHPNRPQMTKSSLMPSFMSDQMNPTAFMIAHGLLTLRSLKFSLPERTMIKSETRSFVSNRSLPSTPEKDNFAFLNDTPPKLLCLSHKRDHHSLTCIHNLNTKTYCRELYSTAAANHHRLLNYNFRAQAAFGKLFRNRIHCSCLTLHSNNEDDQEFIVTRL